MRRSLSEWSGKQRTARSLSPATDRLSRQVSIAQGVKTSSLVSFFPPRLKSARKVYPVAPTLRNPVVSQYLHRFDRKPQASEARRFAPSFQGVKLIIRPLAERKRGASLPSGKRIVEARLYR